MPEKPLRELFNVPLVLGVPMTHERAELLKGPVADAISDIEQWDSLVKEVVIQPCPGGIKISAVPVDESVGHVPTMVPVFVQVCSECESSSQAQFDSLNRSYRMPHDDGCAVGLVEGVMES